MPLAAGSQLGRFRIVRPLGAGAMGEVYLAEDPQIERLLAIKTVRVQAGGEEIEKGLRERLTREAKAAGRLVHPHVVTLFEAGEIGGTFYLAFEYIEGSDLGARMRREPPLTVDDALRIVREAASGLAAAHRRGIVHRDVKPSNLLLDAEGTVKVTDFGIAKLVGEGTSYTASGSIVGSPQYLSPEQVRTETLDGRSDLFSLGVVLYELLAQRRPFDGDTFTALMYQILLQDPPSIADLRPQVPPRLAAVVTRLLAKDRNQRFPSGEALVEELAAIEGEQAAMRDRPTVTLPERSAPPPLPPAPVAAVIGHHAEHAALAPVAAESGREAPPAPQPRRTAPSRRWWLVAGLAGFSILVLAVIAALVLPEIFDRKGTRDDAATAADEDAAGEAPDESSPVVPAEERSAVPQPVDPLPADRGAAQSETGPPPEPERAGADSSQRVDRPEEVAAAPPRIVGATLTFVVSPAEAARHAVVKIDGLPRGPASGSLMTLRPGAHRIELVAPGFEPLVVEVESRPGASSPTRLELAMRRTAAGAESATP